MAIDPPPRVDQAAFFSNLGGGLPARDPLDVRFALGKRAPDTHLGIPGAVDALGVRLDPKVFVVLDQHSLSPSGLSGTVP